MTDSKKPEPTGTTRREALKRMGISAMGITAAYGVTPPMIEEFKKKLMKGAYRAEFFSESEMQTMRVLADMIIPADEVSGSATDAGTVEYADFVLSISGEDTQRQWRTGLAWLDEETARRFDGRRFVACTSDQRAAILDDIAWPRRADDRFEEQVEWFNRVRDLVGSGFFSSEMGVADIDYRGNVYVVSWQGAPRTATNELGVSYEEWDRRYGGNE